VGEDTPLTIISTSSCINLKAELKKKLPTPRLIKEEVMLPTEIAMSELTDTELDAVCGGLLNFNFGSPVTQTNVSTQVGVALVGLGGLAAVLQSNRQANINI
jgi:hypothetical protein